MSRADEIGSDGVVGTPDSDVVGWSDVLDDGTDEDDHEHGRHCGPSCDPNYEPLMDNRP